MGICHLPAFRLWRRYRSLTAVLGIFFLWLCFISVINPDTSALEPVTRDTAATSIMGFGKGALWSSSSSASSSSSSYSSFRAFIESAASPLEIERDDEYSPHSLSLDALVSIRGKAQPSSQSGPLTVSDLGKLGHQSRDLVNGLIRGRRIQEIRSTKTGIGTDYRLSGVKVSVDIAGNSPSVTENERIDRQTFFPTPATQDISNMQQSIGLHSEAFGRVGQGSSRVSRLDVPPHDGRSNRGQFESPPLDEARNLDSVATRYDHRQRSTVEKLHQDARVEGRLQEQGKSIDYEKLRDEGESDNRWADSYDSGDVVKAINKRFKNDQSDGQKPQRPVKERTWSDLAQNTFKNREGSSVNLNSVMISQSMNGDGPSERRKGEPTPMQMEVDKSPKSEELPSRPYHFISQQGNSDDGLATKFVGGFPPQPSPPAHQASEANEGNGDSLNVLQSSKTLGQQQRVRGNNGSPPYQDFPARDDGEVTNWGWENGHEAGIDESLGIGSRDETIQLVGDLKGREERKKEEKMDENEKGSVIRDGIDLDGMRRANRSPVAGSSGSSDASNDTTATTATDATSWKVGKGRRRLKSDGFQQYAYNVTASDAIGMRRHLPDTRPPGCDVHRAYTQSNLPKATVVICFHNEALSVLLRTIHSVLDRTPSYLLDQIIMVDDNSTFDELGEELPRHLHLFGPDVVLKRTKGRQGLTRARLLGASQAKSPVIVFLDSHVECNVGWLEPLLSALVDNPNMVVSPYIDTIKSENFQYKRSPSGLQGGFNWRLEFGWRAASTHSTEFDSPEPIRTPVISGGLFAVRTQYFNAIGGYDPKLDIWGGENFELSFKTWMCGGSMAILPCSRVGHVFRASLPYQFKDGLETTVLRNLARVANVWMDEFSTIFEAAVNLPTNFPIGDISDRLAIRQRLRCKSFQWYLEHVFPQMEMVPQNAIFYGQVKNKGSLMCIEVKKDNSQHYLGLSACKGGDNQTLYLTNEGLLMYGEACVTPSSDKLLTVSACGQNFTWIFQEKRLHAASAKDLCLVSVDNEVVQLLPCVSTNKNLNVKSKNYDANSSNKPKHQAAIPSQKHSLDFLEENIFEQWKFDYSFNWKRRRRR